MINWFVRYLSGSHYRTKIAEDIDLDDKSIVKKVFKMAWPSTLESVLISLISSMDTIMIGVLGSAAISAIGVTAQPRFLILAPLMALNIGVTILVSRRKGQQDQSGANSVLKTALIISIGLSFLVNFIGFVFARELLSFAGANSDYLTDALAYFRVVMVGNFFYCISLTITAAQRGVGNTKISMVTNLSANIINIIFNYLLINGIWIFPKWGVFGDGVATALGNVVAFLIALYSVSKKSGYLQLNFKGNGSFSLSNLKLITQLAMPSAIEQIFMRFGFFIFSKQVFELGTLASTSHHISMNIMNLSFSFGDGLAIAATSLIGQSLGARKIGLAKIYGKAVNNFGHLASFSISIFVLVMRYPLISLFTRDAVVVNLAAQLLLILALITYFQIAQVITIGILRGAGDVQFVAYLTAFSIMIVRPSLAYILAYGMHFGVVGAWVGITIDQILRYALSLLRYNSGEWVKIEL